MGCIQYRFSVKGNCVVRLPRNDICARSVPYFGLADKLQYPEPLRQHSITQGCQMRVPLVSLSCYRGRQGAET